jgi:formate-dependent nitrite reductase cytochrome c552 subunit
LRLDVRAWGRVCVWGACLGAALALEASQPIAYSHKQHIAMGLACTDCHSSADIGTAATIPSVQKCMLCHAKVAATKPEIQKLAAFAKSGREVPWERVYGFPREADVKFNHGAHFRANVACSVCHGDMTQATTAQLLVKHNMGTCLSCHRQSHAPEDCAACHY